MTLFLTLFFPYYLLGNLHCAGMCGPLVLMIGQHRCRYWYFLGRAFSFTLTGMAAGESGAVLNLLLHQYHIPAAANMVFGAVILLVGCYSLAGKQYPGHLWLSKRLGGANQRLSLLMLRDRAWPTFLFGFFTIALPCGQTLVVFSACALSGDLWVGMGNGLAFALLTSPSLFFAMHAHLLFRRLKPHYNTILGVCSLAIGVFTLYKGFAMLWRESGVQ